MEKGEPMSILIKGIDMPKASNDDMIVIIRHDSNAEVWQSGKKQKHKSYR